MTGRAVCNKGSESEPETRARKSAQTFDADGEDALFSNSLIAYVHAREARFFFSDEDLVASGTWHKYEARVAALARSHPRNDPFAAYLSRDRSDAWENKNTRQATRSALIRIAGRLIGACAPVYWKERLTKAASEQERRALSKALKAVVDEEGKGRMRSANTPLNDEEHHQLAAAVAFIVAVPPDPTHRAMREQCQQKPGKSERSEPPALTVLRALHRHELSKQKRTPNYCWREHFWNTVRADSYVSSDRCAIIAVMLLVGIRPVEFTARLGVTIEATVEAGKPALKFDVAGAKTAAELAPGIPAKGQHTRTIWLVCKTREAFWLHEHIARSGNSCLEIKEALSPVSPSGKYLSPTEQERRLTVSLGKLITRIGKVAFPRQKGHVTPYVFRHAFAADMAAGGRFPEATIAASLGQQSVRTLKHYGKTNRGRRASAFRCQQVVRIEAASPVRPQSPNPFRPIIPDPDAT